MSAGALAIISIVWREAAPMPTEYMVVPLALIAAAVSIAVRSPNSELCTPSVSSQIMSGVLELTRRGLFLATVTPDKRPSEMYVSP